MERKGWGIHTHTHTHADTDTDTLECYRGEEKCALTMVEAPLLLWENTRMYTHRHTHKLKHTHTHTRMHIHKHKHQPMNTHSIELCITYTY